MGCGSPVTAPCRTEWLQLPAEPQGENQLPWSKVESLTTQGEAPSIKPAHALEKHFCAHKLSPLCHTSMALLGTGQPKPEAPECPKSCLVYSGRVWRGLSIRKALMLTSLTLHITQRLPLYLQAGRGPTAPLPLSELPRATAAALAQHTRVCLCHTAPQHPTLSTKHSKGAAGAT